MGIEIRQIERTDLHAWCDAMAIGFMDRPHPGRYAAAEAHFSANRDIGVFDGTKIVGTYVSFPTDVSLPGGSTVLANAISGVTVLPTHRKRGILRRAISADLIQAKDRGDAVALLRASEFSIYSRFGFGVATEAQTIEIDTRGIEFLSGSQDGSVELVEPASATDTCSPAFATMRRQRSGAMNRDSVFWRRTFGLLEDYPEGMWKGSVAVSRNAQGQVDGYARYRTASAWPNDRPEATVHIDELIETSPASHLRLWDYLCSMAWVTKVVMEEGCVDDDIAFQLVDQRAIKRHGPGDQKWARLLDVQTICTTRTYGIEQKLTIEVTDEAGLANGRFTLDASASGSTCKRSRSKVDLTMSVNDLSSLVFGGSSAAQLTRVGRIQEHTGSASLFADQLFRTSRSPWNPTAF